MMWLRNIRFGRTHLQMRQSILGLLAICSAVLIVLGAAQVSGAHFNDAGYSPGPVPTFTGLDEAAANNRLNDALKFVSDLQADINTAERDGDITSARASQLRADVSAKVGQMYANYNAWKASRTPAPAPAPKPAVTPAPKPSPQSDGGSSGGGQEGSSSGADAGELGARPRSHGQSQGGSPGKGRGNSGGRPNAPTPNANPQGKPGALPVAGGVAGLFAASNGSGSGDSKGNKGGSRSGAGDDRLTGNIDSNVVIDFTNPDSLRAALTGATSSVPLGFQALLLILLFAVALLLVLVFRERRRTQQVERVSQLDYLTGLANREGFDRMMAIEWRRTIRYGHTLGMVFIDLDEFKRFNDTNGHLAGDRLLREVASVINSEARASDYTARLGGDEFVILCPQTDAEGLEALTKRLEGASVGLPVSLSIGFTHQTATDTTPEDLIGRADAAMYAAKAGRGSFPVPGGSGSRSEFSA
ncbi:MAG: GGDEF domain-containing protein [Thermoleophilaceae bacterium]|nr:GGDEF domain-containing protein [Thermoleophilaceae bacterium]